MGLIVRILTFAQIFFYEMILSNKSKIKYMLELVIYFSLIRSQLAYVIFITQWDSLTFWQIYSDITIQSVLLSNKNWMVFVCFCSTFNRFILFLTDFKKFKRLVLSLGIGTIM